MSISRMEIKVWRPNNIEKEYYDCTNFHSADMSRFLQICYTWMIRESFFSGVINQVDQKKLEELFLRFEPRNKPEERKVSDLRKVIEFLEDIVNRGYTDWSSSETERIKMTSDGETTLSLRFNPLISLKSHLEWILSTFEHIPEVSVTIRV